MRRALFWVGLAVLLGALVAGAFDPGMCSTYAGEYLSAQWGCHQRHDIAWWRTIGFLLFAVSFYLPRRARSCT